MTTATITLPTRSTTASILRFTHNKGISVFVEYLTGTVDVNDVFTNDNFPALNYTIMSNQYAELMSANPSWATTKPAGTFREQDLWYFINGGS